MMVLFTFQPMSCTVRVTWPAGQRIDWTDLMISNQYYQHLIIVIYLSTIYSKGSMATSSSHTLTYSEFLILMCTF